MQVPAAQDLVAEKFLRPPRTARGVYLDRRPGHDDVQMRLAWAAPDKWLWMHKADPLAGAVTDGTTNVIVEDGVAVLVTDDGEVGTTHRLRNLLRPRGYDFEGWELGPVTAGTLIGRSAWFFSVTPTLEGKAAHEVVFDAESSVLLCMRADEFYLGFEELELDEDIPETTFQWTGPVEPRRIGSALVIHEDAGHYSVLWEISVRGRSMFHHDGPAGLTKDEAVGWGEERATRTQIRPEPTRR